MTNKTLSILVIISLAFNTAFLGTFLFHRIAENKIRHKYQKNYPKLHCIMQEIREELTPLHEHTAQRKLEFITELRNPQFNEANLKEKLDQVIKAQLEMEQNLGEMLIKMRSEMSPEQLDFFLHLKKLPQAHPQKQNFRPVPGILYGTRIRRPVYRCFDGL